MKRQPNLLYVFADQWRRQAVGFIQEDMVHTPHMDAFAADALAFDNAITVNPLCSPHRASLLCGKYATSHDVYTNCKPGLPEVGLGEQEICLGDVLRSAGYDTAYIGKWHLDAAEENFAARPSSGASGWDAYTPPGPKRHGFDYWYSYGTFDDHLHPHYWRDTPQQLPHRGWSAEHETDMALSWLQSRSGDAPFALMLSWNPPHNPYELVPERYRQLYEALPLRQRQNVDLTKGYLLSYASDTPLPFSPLGYLQMLRDYFAAVSGLDAQFGRLVSYLQQAGLYEDTIIVLSADHGDMMGSHGLLAKHVWYEESIGVPFVIRYGSHLRRGMEHAVLNTPDILPTLLDLAGLPIPQEVEGESFGACMRGCGAATAEHALIQGMPGGAALIADLKRQGISPREMGWRALRSEKSLYVALRGFQTGQPFTRLFYDLQADPYQQQPKVLDEHAARPYESIMKTMMKRAKDPFSFA